MKPLREGAINKARAASIPAGKPAESQPQAPPVDCELTQLQTNLIREAQRHLYGHRQFRDHKQLYDIFPYIEREITHLISESSESVLLKNRKQFDATFAGVHAASRLGPSEEARKMLINDLLSLKAALNKAQARRDKQLMKGLRIKSRLSTPYIMFLQGGAPGLGKKA
jgi:hypothetical protein